VALGTNSGRSLEDTKEQPMMDEERKAKADEQVPQGCTCGIDAQFACMAEDADYQKEAQLLAEEFEHSDWEALGLKETDLEEEPAYAPGVNEVERL